MAASIAVKEASSLIQPLRFEGVEQARGYAATAARHTRAMVRLVVPKNKQVSPMDSPTCRRQLLKRST